MNNKEQNSVNTQHNGPKTERTPMEELEVALEECKFGRFHIRYLFAVMVSSMANVLVSANTAYLLPNAECDLMMTINQKGILNAMAYVGMLASGFFAGFLTDTFGRKIFLVYGYFGIFICCLIEGSSQTYEVLLAAKFAEGFVFSAAFNAVIAMTSEVTCKKIRDRIMVCSSSFVAFAHVFIALFSWMILPYDWRFVFFDGAFVLSSWNIYLYACGLFSLTASLLYLFIPESTKYLVAHQRYKEVMQILRQIYKENTGKSIETFPIKSIGTSAFPRSPSAVSVTQNRTLINQIVRSLIDIKPIFRRPLSLYLILICFMQVMTMLVYNVLRLWYPQLSTIIEHYRSDSSRPAEDLCLMLDSYMLDKAQQLNTTHEDSACIPNRSGTETYMNSVIMGCVCVVPYILTAFLITRVGKKLLIVISLAISCGCISSLGWSSSSLEVVALVSTAVALTQTCVTLMQTIVVEVFPTVTRSLSISLAMMAGRIGTLTGNILFPILLAQGCLIPFFSISTLLIIVMLLSVLLPTSGFRPKN